MTSSTPAVAADVNPLTVTADKATVVRGDSVTLTLTFTNPDSAGIYFSYVSVNPNYGTVIDGLKFEFTSCAGEVSWCNAVAPGSQGGALQYTVPILAGTTRTATLTYRVTEDSTCGGAKNVGFYFYTYRESSAGAFEYTANGPTTLVSCPAS
ncbi:hypothetical protein [Goodfellowiella coeruleoviolacea]|nr:hypothetical protein [Goodfellowiella coeruleoviolacea]